LVWTLEQQRYKNGLATYVELWAQDAVTDGLVDVLDLLDRETFYNATTDEVVVASYSQFTPTDYWSELGVEQDVQDLLTTAALFTLAEQEELLGDLQDVWEETLVSAAAEEG